MTARSALRVLREEGLIYTVQGRGSYVADVIGPGGELIEAKQLRAGDWRRPGKRGSRRAPGRSTLEIGEQGFGSILPGPLTDHSSVAVGRNSARNPPSTANAARNNSVSNLLALPSGI